MRPTVLHASALLLVLSRAATAFAQTPTSLSLEEAVTRGLGAAPRLAEARAREAAAAATDAARVALGRPMLAVMSGLLRTNHVDLFGVPLADGRTRIIFPDIPTNVHVRAEMSIPIFTGGRVEALVGAARSERAASAAETRAVAADITLEISNAYWALVMVRERRVVLGRALERADAVVSDVQARVDTGFAPPNEVQTAQAQRARQRVQFIQAGADVTVAEAQLARLAGLVPGDPILPTTAADQPTAGIGELAGLPAAALTARAQASRPERAALIAREGSIRLAGRASGAALLPQVAGLAAIEGARPNPRFVPRTDEWNRSWDLGVNVTWSVWDGGRARADVAAATAQADAAHARVVEFDAGVAVEVRQRLADLSSGRAAIDASSEGVEAAREAARVLQERFAAGVATSTDLLDANLALLEAELERTRLATVLRINEARLVRTVGGPTP